MRRPFCRQLPALLLLAAMAAGAQVDNSNQNGQSPGSPPGASATPTDASSAPTTPATTRPQVTVSGKAPRAEQPLPALPADEFPQCMRKVGGVDADVRNLGPGGPPPALLLEEKMCEEQLNREKHIVFEACVDRSGDTALPRVIQACTELLDRKIVEGSARSSVLTDRARAYLAQGDKQHALDDYNEAIRLAPHNAELYYARGVFYALQSDDAAALRDFDTAIGINSRLVPALRQRAKIHQARGSFGDARADYSQAIGVQPKSAALWSERGYVCLRQHDYESAVRDEAQAIQLDPKLARAYFLRGAAAAFGGLGDRADAVSDIRTGVRLDPSLDRYVTSKGKTAFLALPPL